MKSNKIVTYKINEKYTAFYVTDGNRILIKSNDLPNKLIQSLMNKKNARYFEIRKWIRLNYNDNIISIIDSFKP